MADGLKQYRAFRVMLTVFRSLWFLGDVVAEAAPEIGKKPEQVSFKDFAGWFFSLDKDRRQELFKLGAMFGAQLDNDELLAICYMYTDKNGVGLNKSNIDNLSALELMNAIATACADLSEQKVFF